MGLHALQTHDSWDLVLCPCCQFPPKWHRAAYTQVPKEKQLVPRPKQSGVSVLSVMIY